MTLIRVSKSGGGIASTFLFVLEFLNFHLLGIHDVPPPVVMDTIDAPGHTRDATQPPLVVSTDIAVAPIPGVDLLESPLEIREVEPIIAITGNHTWVAPIVITIAIGREMD